MHVLYVASLPITPVTISSNVDTMFNIYTAAGSPSPTGGAVLVLLTVAAGVRVRSLTAGGAWPPASLIRIVNYGVIYGSGGNGAAAGAGAGTGGGNALTGAANITIEIYNVGYMVGGGGAGGGGADGAGGHSEIPRGGGGAGGAGGGAGGVGGGMPGGVYWDGTPGADGTAGALPNYAGGVWTNLIGTGAGSGAAGAGGTARNGLYDPYYYGGRGGGAGGWGEAGGAGRNGNGQINDAGSELVSAAGGAAGRAVLANGALVVWKSGNNSTQVRGAI